MIDAREYVAVAAVVAAAAAAAPIKIIFSLHIAFEWRAIKIWFIMHTSSTYTHNNLLTTVLFLECELSALHVGDICNRILLHTVSERNS